MLKKFSAILLVSFLLTSGVAQAYDLPKLKPDKKISQQAEQKKGSMLKSDWTSAELFEQSIKARLESGEKLAPNDPARVSTDKNYVFIAFYNDAPFFLDKYSIKVKKNSDGLQVWEQQIFPISKNYSPKNAKATRQKFCLADGKFFNSTKAENALSAVANESDRIFLEECFRVGYYFAFGQEI
ncbi:MAG: hypothetical protein IJK81_06645 [Selenomonadaceae bacterium]|nr:hypothetical protein [Selenomonadaceae bacterium]